jgi:Domain of unknown function (DUF1905)/Bacteriocin-protection, YdeI or OmpD-Associated
MARRQSPQTTKLYDRTKDEITLSEVERIRLRSIGASLQTSTTFRELVLRIERQLKHARLRREGNGSKFLAVNHIPVKRSPTAGKKLSFQAKLENWAEGMDYCAVPVPASVTQALGTKGPVLVMARVNDSEPFKVSLFPTGGGQHYIRIKAKVRKETRTKTGDRVRVRFTVLDRSDVTIPTDLIKALRAEGVTDGFKSLPPGKQNFIIRRIDDAAKPETRDKRIQEAVEAAHRMREKRIDQSK